MYTLLGSFIKTYLPSPSLLKHKSEIVLTTPQALGIDKFICAANSCGLKKVLARIVCLFRSRELYRDTKPNRNCSVPDKILSIVLESKIKK